MIEQLTNFLIKRRMKHLHIPVPVDDTSPMGELYRVLNTIRENKVMVKTMEDGIYIRMAGSERNGECFSYEWAKVKSFM